MKLTANDRIGGAKLPRRDETNAAIVSIDKIRLARNLLDAKTREGLPAREGDIN
jgi:hypothetical protein